MDLYKRNKESLLLAIIEFTCQTFDLGACFWKSCIDLMFEICPHALPLCIHTTSMVWLSTFISILSSGGDRLLSYGCPHLTGVESFTLAGRKADIDELGT
jgi:hypothetical protein